jgi:hypothetical protein
MTDEKRKIVKHALIRLKTKHRDGKRRDFEIDVINIARHCSRLVYRQWACCDLIEKHYNAGTVNNLLKRVERLGEVR